MSNKYYKKMIGEKCYLSPISMQDVEHYTEWMNDYQITLNLGLADSIINSEKEKTILERLSSGKDYVFAMIDRETNKLIGNVGIHDVNFIDGYAEAGILIGDRNFWGRGYGQDALKLALDFAFNILNLYSVHLRVLSFNQRGISAYKKVGFQEVGALKRVRKIANQRYDLILMQIFAEDFVSPYINKVLDETQTSKNSLQLKLEI